MLALVAAIFAYPVIQLFHFSLLNVSTSQYSPTTFAGLSNFRYIFSDPLFRTALENNLKLFLCVPILVFLSAVLAAMLFDRPRGWRFYRTLLFLPYVLSIPVVGIVFSYSFQKNGTANSLLDSAHVGFLGQDWLGTPGWALATLMFVIIWKELGFGIILCLARLMSVDQQLFEAARVDGARWWRVFIHITIPQLGPALAVYAVVELINMLSWVFAYVYVMTAGGPQNSTVVTEYYIYSSVFSNNLVGVGAAAGVILLGVVSVMIILRLWVRGRFVAVTYE